MARSALTQPACGSTEDHRFHEHTWMDHEFKEYSVWCNGVCNCGCTCWEHKGKPHGPGAHK